MVSRSQRQGIPRAARIMLFIFACLLAAAAAAPATFDQRQDGRRNVQADVTNIMFLFVVPSKLPFSVDVLEALLSARQKSRDAAQDRSDVQVTKSFVEPSTPYRVEIGAEEGRSENNGEGAVEVVISGRRQSDPATRPEKTEYKLIGALEQCGPDRERDPVSLMCRPQSQVVPEEIPAVVEASS